ncbi:MAG: radical SAM protein, partial [Oscillospiraceae bacterium]|nr:radical SAM protein [Oscillospiraceae bacterium]
LKDEGYEPDIWDGQVEEISLKEKLISLKPDFVYVCGRTRQENFMKEYCKAAKELCGSVTFIGGLHAQHNYKRFYDDYIDYIMITFDIYKLKDIINKKNLSEIDGICYKKNGKWLENEPEPFDIERLPVPDRTYFYKHNDRYRYLELLPCAHIITAYCCPYRCKFCYRNRLNCGVYSARSIESVVDEIESINCENIYIIDDDFLVDEKRVTEFIRLIKKRNIRKKYVCYGRADFISKYPQLMKELKEIGFYYILTGLEAIDEKYLSDYNKLSDMSCNTKAIEILNEVGINIMGMFIVDLDFSAGDFSSMYKWIKRNKLRHTAISILTPEMSSELMEQYKDRLITDNPEEWDYLHVVAKPLKMSVKMYYFHYHILLVKLFVRGWRDGIYDFVDYGYYIKSFLKNMFGFGG